MNISDIKEEYDKVAKYYEKSALPNKYRAYEKVAKLVLNFYDKDSAKVLDLGCGTGLSSVEFFKKNFEVVGVDVSEGMLKEAERYPYKKLICQDLEKPLKVEDDFFDIIILTGVMEFIKNPLDLFLEIKSKLKSDGFFALTVPEKYPEGSYLRDKFHRRSYDKKEIEPVFEEAGFKILKMKRIFGYRREIEDRVEKSYFYVYVLKKK